MLNKRIAILTKSETRGEFNEPVITWNESFSTWAEVGRSEEDRRFLVGGEEFITSLQIKVRYRGDIGDENMVRFNGKDFQIVSVENERQENRYLFLFLVDYSGE